MKKPLRFIRIGDENIFVGNDVDFRYNGKIQRYGEIFELDLDRKIAKILSEAGEELEIEFDEILGITEIPEDAEFVKNFDEQSWKGDKEHENDR